MEVQPPAFKKKNKASDLDDMEEEKVPQQVDMDEGEHERGQVDRDEEQQGQDDMSENIPELDSNPTRLPLLDLESEHFVS